jgi:hypothetical protein
VDREDSLKLYFGDWEVRPIEDLVKGDEVFIFDPTCEPEVFRGIVSELKTCRKNGRYPELIGLTYFIPVEDEPVKIKGKDKIINSETFSYWAPKNRVGFHKLYEIDYMDQVRDYDS